MKIYFDLSQQERWHRSEWESRLALAAAAQSQVALASSRSEADFVISPEAPQLNSGLSAIFGKVPDDEIVWDSGDHPAGRHPGFYSSLRRELFNPAIHRSFCFPITFNEQIRQFDTGDATNLYSFIGGITSPLRSRLVRHLSTHPMRSRGVIKVQGGQWLSMFDRAGLATKLEFAESLRRARFILCPRGNGVGVMRLFEAMEGGRVPVIISDGYVLPEGVEWEKCSVIIKERELDQIPDMLAKKEPEWETMALRARQSWEDHFSPASLLTEMAVHLGPISSAVNAGVRPGIVPLLSSLAIYHAKSVYRKLQHLAALGRGARS